MLSLGQDEQARSLLSRLRASPVMKRETTTNQGFLWFALARAVTATTGETAEGRGLAVRAEAAFSQRAVDRRELDEVREWLAALPPTPSG